MSGDSSGVQDEQKQHNYSDEQCVKGPWTAPVIRSDDDKPIGTSLFLGAEDLNRMGIDLDETTEIAYHITDNNRLIIDDEH